jgi:hypothetical protein
MMLLKDGNSRTEIHEVSLVPKRPPPLRSGFWPRTVKAIG